jgi:transposase
MRNFDLTNEEVQELRAAHKSAKNKSDAYRINAVILLGSDWSLEEVVDALLLDDETLRNYVSRYKTGGLEKLLEHHYKGGLPKLPIEFFVPLMQELDSRIYLTTKDICAYVQDRFEVTYTISGMTALLHRLDYVYKKPKLVPGLSDEGLKEIFLEQYLDFMKNKGEDEVVFFVDAVHPTHNSMPTYGWIKKGTEQELQTNSGRSRFNIHGAMNAETFETTIIASEDNVNADSTIALCECLEKSYPLALALYLIIDNARYHFSKPVMEYLQNSRIKLVRLPPYSPELNLIERLWKVLKKKVLYNKHHEHFKDFKKSLLGFFKNQSEHYEEIASIMGDGLAGLVV